jgi:hypothetical protein
MPTPTPTELARARANIVLAMTGGADYLAGALGALAALGREFLDREVGLTDAEVEDYTHRLDAGWLAAVEEQGWQAEWARALAQAGG